MVIYSIPKPWLITACWDGQNRRVRFRLDNYDDAEFWLRWCKRNEPNTDPKIEFQEDECHVG